jgi:hypothetical protein
MQYIALDLLVATMAFWSIYKIVALFTQGIVVLFHEAVLKCLSTLRAEKVFLVPHFAQRRHELL